MRLSSLVLVNLAGIPLVLAMANPIVPLQTPSPAPHHLDARQTTAPKTSTRLAREPCFDKINDFAIQNPRPTVDSALRDWYQTGLFSMTARAPFPSGPNGLQTMQSQYKAYCTELYGAIYAETQTVPPSVSAAHLSYYSAWSSRASSLQSQGYSIASFCLFDSPVRFDGRTSSEWAGDVLHELATDADSCVTAYDVMAFGSSSFVDARTTAPAAATATASGTSSTAPPVHSTPATAGAAKRDKSWTELAFVLAGVVGAWIL
ncbi:hypothetical protein QBC44DRAFT_373004 [Cladorrhinum sp. PSN332]|nr:hypothetical protein QBC44DRAFT_373004 [Cladorrhinum sp. PSN332]